MALISGGTINSLADEVNGVTAVTIPRGVCSAIGAAGTSGTLYLRAIALPPGLTVSNLDFQMAGTGATTPAHQWMCLATPGGVVLAVTADNTAGQAANTYYRAAVTVPYTTVPGQQPQVFLIGIMLAAATVTAVVGAPAFVANPTFSGVSGTVANIGSTGGTGFTTPPAVGTQLTLTSVAGTSTNFYAATA